MLLADAVFSDQSHVSTLRLQGVSHRCAALHGRSLSTRDDRQHARRGVARLGARDDSGTRDGRLRRTFRVPLRGSFDWRPQPQRTRGTPVFIHRKQLSGRTNVRRLERSEPASAPVARPRQWRPQKTYSRRAARTLRGGTSALETVAGVDSRGVSNAPAHRRRGRLRLGALDSLLGAGGLDRTASGSARDARQDGDRTGCAAYRNTCACADAAAATHHAPRTQAAARRRRQARRSASGRTSSCGGRAGDCALYCGIEEKGPQSGCPCPAATVAAVARISARVVSRRGERSGALRTLRSGSSGTHDSATHRARLFSVGRGRRQ